MKKEVSKLKKSAYKDFTPNSRKLKSDGNPKEYRSLINTRNVNQVQVNSRGLYNHFRELSTAIPQERAQVVKGDSEKQETWQFDISELDKPFEEDEIGEAVSKLKTNKVARGLTFSSIN